MDYCTKTPEPDSEHDAHKRSPNYNQLIIIGIIFMFAGLFIVVESNVELKDWLKYHLIYSNYLAWKKNGGVMKDEYYEALTLDKNKDQIIAGLSLSEIRVKFPSMTEGEAYSPDSYKGQYLIGIKRRKPNVKLFWFKKEDGSDWCIEVENGTKTLKLVKG